MKQKIQQAIEKHEKRLRLASNRVVQQSVRYQLAADIAKLSEADKADALQVQDAAWKEIEEQHLLDLSNALLTKNAEWNELCEERDIRISELESGNAAWQSIAEQKDEIMVMQRKALATAQAQVAVMVEAVELAGNAILHPDQYDLNGVIESLEAALSAAPKVKCVLEGRWIPEPSLPGRVDLDLVSITEHGDKRVAIVTVSPSLSDKGEAVNVIVLDKQGE